MLSIDRQALERIIEEVRKNSAGIVDDDEDPGSDLAHGDIEDLDDETETEEDLAGLHALIDELPEDARVELVALAWIGRGSYGKEDWHDALVEAARVRNDHTAGYLLGMPLLADYLEEGLATLE